ncbi:hypothetical protein FACS189443_4510 [Planctomycetales bacterium]|nr:hypothetical protein FACS189443_4510 [Planctomycetales bacterium]
MPQSVHRKTYSEPVKREAVCRVLINHHSQKSVARQLGCSPDSLRDWLKKYRRDVLAEEQQPDFASVKIPSEASHHQALEIITPHGFTLRLPAATPLPQLAELLRSLEPQC